MSVMRIGAFGDLHGDRFMEFLIPSLGDLAEIDLLLLAGDVVDKDDIDSFARTLELIRRTTDAKIISVFGNEEYSQSYEEYRERFAITFLDDESISLDVVDLKVRIVGTQGSLDRPTWWQRTHLPGIWQRYRERVGRVSELLVRGEEDILILLMHYSPTYLTLEGETESRLQEMGSRMFEEVIMLRKPDLVLHGHSHRGRIEADVFERQTSLEDFGRSRKSVPVLNVALPLVGAVTMLEMWSDADGFHFARIEKDKDT